METSAGRESIFDSYRKSLCNGRNWIASDLLGSQEDSIIHRRIAVEVVGSMDRPCPTCPHPQQVYFARNWEQTFATSQIKIGPSTVYCGLDQGKGQCRSWHIVKIALPEIWKRGHRGWQHWKRIYISCVDGRPVRGSRSTRLHHQPAEGRETVRSPKSLRLGVQQVKVKGGRECVARQTRGVRWSPGPVLEPQGWLCHRQQWVHHQNRETGHPKRFTTNLFEEAAGHAPTVR